MSLHAWFKWGLLWSLLLVTGANCSAAVADVILVTGAENPISELDKRQVRSLYKGRLTALKGQSLKPLNAAPGSVDRLEFLARVMGQNELDYTGYWHVRRYTGQGTPPLEVASQSELFEQLKQQPGGVGYLWSPPDKPVKLPEGLKIIKLRD